MPVSRALSEEAAANLALSHLRESEIAILETDNNQRAREARKWFGTARDALLRRKWWNFAKAYVSPAMDPVEGVGGTLKKRFPLPSDCLMVRSVDGLSNDEWEVATAITDNAGNQVEAPVLLTATDNPVVCYTRRVTNVSLWDAEFLIAFAKDLASLMAPAFGKSFGETQAREAAAKEKVDQAATVDAREKAPTQLPTDTSWIRARRGFRAPW